MNDVKIGINQGVFDVDDREIERWIKVALDKLINLEKLDVNQKVRISVAMVDSGEIKKINKKWRNKNEKTDVLSFCYENTHDRLEGEIILCFGVIARNAKKDKIKFEEELKKNVIHSLLHIVGFKHGDAMFELQAQIIELC